MVLFLMYKLTFLSTMQLLRLYFKPIYSLHKNIKIFWVPYFSSQYYFPTFPVLLIKWHFYSMACFFYKEIVYIWTHIHWVYRIIITFEAFLFIWILFSHSLRVLLIKMPFFGPIQWPVFSNRHIVYIWHTKPSTV